MRWRTIPPCGMSWWHTASVSALKHFKTREERTMHRRQFLTSAAVAATLFVAAPSFAADTAQSVVEAYVAAWNAHDSAKAAGYFADDVTYYDASVGKPVKGKEAAKTGVIDNF